MFIHYVYIYIYIYTHLNRCKLFKHACIQKCIMHALSSFRVFKYTIANNLDKIVHLYVFIYIYIYILMRIT